MVTSHLHLHLATISTLNNNTHLRRSNNTLKDRFPSSNIPPKTHTKLNNPALLLPNTSPLNSHKPTPLIHLITLPRMHPANRSTPSTRTPRVQVLTEFHLEHLVSHLMNLIDRLLNLEQREWGLEINQQLGKLIIDNKPSRDIKSPNTNSKESTLLSMVLRLTLPNSISSKVRDLVVMDMGMLHRSKGLLME